MYCLQPYVYYYISLFSEERYREAPLLFFQTSRFLHQNHLEFPFALLRNSNILRKPVVRFILVSYRVHKKIEVDAGRCQPRKKLIL